MRCVPPEDGGDDYGGDDGSNDDSPPPSKADTAVAALGLGLAVLGAVADSSSSDDD